MKKLNKLFAILVAMAMVLSLTAVSAFAATTNTEKKGAAIEKIMKMPKGVDPAGSVTITATLQTVDGASPQTAVTLSDTINLAKANAVLADTTSDPATDIYYYGTKDLLDSFNPTSGGHYVFKIAETANVDTTGLENATVKNDTTEYQLTVNVNSEKEVKSVYIGTDANKKELYDTINSANATKVAEDGTSFVNSVTQVRPGDSYDNSAFKVMKEVKGADENDIADKTTRFEIEVTVNLPDTDGAKAEFVTTGETTQTSPITKSGTFTVKLADGERLYFTSIPVGAQVSTKETDARAQANGDYIKAGEQALANITADNKLGGTITNTHKDTGNTGILMSNLPYIVLALVAIGGMVAYVVVRRRNADEA